MEITAAPNVAGLFNSFVKITVGTGDSLLFWEDPWINDIGAASIAPAVVALVKPATRRRRKVHDGLLQHAWATYISSPLSVETIVQYLHLWASVAEVERADGPDVLACKWTPNGCFSSRSAYRMLFEGTTALLGAANVWNAFAPLKFKFHAWLALRGRCWTVDRMRRRMMASHTIYPLCNIDDESLGHLSLQCTFPSVVWAGVIVALPFAIDMPTGQLCEWWPDDVDRLPTSRHKDANSIIMLFLCALWLERNARVFNGHSSTAASVLAYVLSTWDSWLSGRGRGRLIGDVN
ncbi:hypothetical protein ACQ4PT_045014 [Festuca glaucescens]